MRTNTLAWIVAVALLAPAMVRGQELFTASNEQDLWVAIVKPPRHVVLLHRRRDDPPFQWQPAADVVGHLTAGGLATADERAWLVYKDMSVQSVGISHEPMSPALLPYLAPKMERGLPAGCDLQSLAASQNFVWALVRVTDPARFAASLTAQRTETAPATMPDETTTQPAATAPATAPDTAPATATYTVAQDVLLVLDRKNWQPTDLPQNWPAGRRNWALCRRDVVRHPQLVTQLRDGRITRFRWNPAKDDWSSSTMAVPAPADAEIRVAMVQGQVIVGWALPSEAETTAAGTTATQSSSRPGLRVQLTWLGDHHATLLGELTLDQPAERPWSLAASGPLIALLGLGDNREIMMARMDLNGQTLAPGMPMAVQGAPSLVADARRMLMSVTMALAMVLLLMAWRRDPKAHRATLPRGVVLADLPRRLMAAVIDLAPAALVSAVFFRMSISELPSHWPGVAATWSGMYPGLATIGFHVVLCLIGEWQWGRTLGKHIMGLRVTKLDGRDPTPGDMLLRNILRPVELIAWYVLPLLVLVSPSRQRLGDMLARTVVVSDLDPDQSEDEG
ncbi:MAG: RDD family protein [Phycisphaeraceae bacterium]|nr:RDD family protein [Phycisphaeraceae bacterium]